MEGILLGVSMFMFAGYNLWLMYLRSKLARWFSNDQSPHVKDYFAAGKVEGREGGRERGFRGGDGGRREGILPHSW